MKTIKIPLNEYEYLIRENERLKKSEEYLKNRLDANICRIVVNIQEIKRTIKGGEIKNEDRDKK